MLHFSASASPRASDGATHNKLRMYFGIAGARDAGDAKAFIGVVVSGKSVVS